MENNVFDGIFKLIGRWKRKVNMKNPYVFGEEKIDLDDFKDLLQKTFDTIKAVKNEYIFKNIYPDAGDMIYFIELISVLSQYGIDDQTVSDESENCAFTATVLLAEELRLYATYWDVNWVEDKKVYFDIEDFSSGNLKFELDYYVDLEEDEENKIYTYNVYEGNFDEILEFAKRIEG